ncbi:MAG: RNA chaperone Hfq [Acidobacteriota bacterium]|nr:MAG: RNA chaperone Hfq [Acidobacteriota bacterium]
MRRGFGDGRERRFGGRGVAQSGDSPRRKSPPPDKTHAEEFYYLKQMNTKTPMVVVLTDGAELRGWIEWYDQDCIKLHHDEQPNVLVFKQHIKYMYKDPDFDADA